MERWPHDKADPVPPPAQYRQNFDEEGAPEKSGGLTRHAASPPHLRRSESDSDLSSVRTAAPNPIVPSRTPHDRCATCSPAWNTFDAVFMQVTQGFALIKGDVLIWL